MHVQIVRVFDLLARLTQRLNFGPLSNWGIPKSEKNVTPKSYRLQLTTAATIRAGSTFDKKSQSSYTRALRAFLSRL